MNLWYWCVCMYCRRGDYSGRRKRWNLIKVKDSCISCFLPSFSLHLITIRTLQQAVHSKLSVWLLEKDVFVAFIKTHIITLRRFSGFHVLSQFWIEFVYINLSSILYWRLAAAHTHTRHTNACQVRICSTLFVGAVRLAFQLFLHLCSSYSLVKT